MYFFNIIVRIVIYNIESVCFCEIKISKSFKFSPFSWLWWSRSSFPWYRRILKFHWFWSQELFYIFDISIMILSSLFCRITFLIHWQSLVILDFDILQKHIFRKSISFFWIRICSIEIKIFHSFVITNLNLTVILIILQGMHTYSINFLINGCHSKKTNEIQFIS